MSRRNFMKSSGRKGVHLALVFALSAASCLVSAQAAQGQGGPRKPPQEALDACKSQAAGQACSFTSDRGAVTGTCWAPEGKPLACKPAGDRGGDGGSRK